MARRTHLHEFWVSVKYNSVCRPGFSSGRPDSSLRQDICPKAQGPHTIHFLGPIILKYPVPSVDQTRPWVYFIFDLIDFWLQFLYSNVLCKKHLSVVYERVNINTTTASTHTWQTCHKMTRTLNDDYATKHLKSLQGDKSLASQISLACINKLN